MKSNRNIHNKRVVKEQKKVIGSAARDDGLEGPKRPLIAEEPKVVVATPEGTLEGPKGPA